MWNFDMDMMWSVQRKAMFHSSLGGWCRTSSVRNLLDFSSLVWQSRSLGFPFLQSVASTIVEAGPCNPTLGAESTMDICETHTWSPPNPQPP